MNKTFMVAAALAIGCNAVNAQETVNFIGKTTSRLRVTL